MFLYGPDAPPFLANNDPCSPSFKGRTCSLIDLSFYVPRQAPMQLPVQTVQLPPPLPAVTHTTPAHIKPVWSIPSSLPRLGDAISYADGECRICRKSDQHTITESANTRWVAETIHRYLRDALAVHPNPGFMIGVAINEEKQQICVAYSSNSASDNAQSNLTGCKFQGYKLKLYGNFGFAEIQKCRGGRDIQQYRGLSLVQVGSSGMRSSETCAASKLVRYMDGPLRKWNMTEIAYGTMQGYTDGVAAASCIGCQQFLPTLLCFES
jgi:hypothetical protein